MQFCAKARDIPFSPYKIRFVADAIRGKNVYQALQWLATCALKRAVPVQKVVASAAANAKNLGGIHSADLFIKTICVDQGPIRRYFKPGAMGRANPQRDRKSHISIVLEPITSKEV